MKPDIAGSRLMWHARRFSHSSSIAALAGLVGEFEAYCDDDDDELVKCDLLVSGPGETLQ